MSLRYDDEFPPLTPLQQTEAIRLASRLQAEHEANSTISVFRAAEEAGIERRFLEEALSQIATDAPMGVPLARREPWQKAELGLLLLTLTGLLAVALIAPGFIPLMAGSVLLSFLVALVPASQGRARRDAYLTALVTGAIIDVALALMRFDVRGEFTNFGLSQLATLILGASLARFAYHLLSSIDRSRDAPHRPQSL